MITVALILFFIYLLVKCDREGYEVFGFSGHRPTPPIQSYPPEFKVSGEEKKVTNATSDLVQFLVKSTMSKFPNECLFPIETNNISKFENESLTIYKCSFTFVRQDTGFPTGVVIQSLVEYPSGKVLGAVTQNAAPPDTASQDLTNMERFDKYEDVLPTKNALDEIQF
tara:strand:- start:207 stop:710 length:504 start_codon:yes stop_codon:yes gene_type:complete